LKLKEEYPSLKIMKGKPLPHGWIGKCWACYNLSLQATGDILCFVDADTFHSSDSIARIVSTFHDTKYDMITDNPRLELITFWEHVIITTYYQMAFTLYPVFLTTYSKNPDFHGGNGQYIAFTRDIYNRLNRHQDVRNKILEDGELVRSVKKIGGTVGFMDLGELAGVRLYRNYNEIWNGYSKNFYYLYDEKNFLMGSILVFLFCINQLPFLYFAYCIIASASQASLIHSIIFIFLIYAKRFAYCYTNKYPMQHMWMGILLGGIWMHLISINSMIWIKYKKIAVWKGRAINTMPLLVKAD